MSFLKKIGGLSIGSLIGYGMYQNIESIEKLHGNNYRLNKDYQEKLDSFKNQFVERARMDFGITYFDNSDPTTEDGGVTIDK